MLPKRNVGIVPRQRLAGLEARAEGELEIVEQRKTIVAHRPPEVNPKGVQRKDAAASAGRRCWPSNPRKDADYRRNSGVKQRTRFANIKSVADPKIAVDFEHGLAVVVGRDYNRAGIQGIMQDNRI